MHVWGSRRDETWLSPSLTPHTAWEQRFPGSLPRPVGGRVSRERNSHETGWQSGRGSGVAWAHVAASTDIHTSSRVVRG